jgi:8-oxo-dGTP diphosphatase
MTDDFYPLAADKTFLVSQKALVIKNGKLLILKATARISGGRSQWELPGGLLELDEPLREGLAREVKEETSLDIEVGQLLALWDVWLPEFTFRDGRTMAVRVILPAYRCETDGDTIQLSKEHSEHRWIGKDDLDDLSFPDEVKQTLAQILS